MKKIFRKLNKKLQQEHDKFRKPAFMQLIQIINKLKNRNDQQLPIEVFKSISHPLIKKSKLIYTTKEFDHDQHYESNRRLPYTIVNITFLNHIL